jgi:exportin-5
MGANGQSGDGMADIIQALEVSHSPTSSNQLRKEALQYLESKKQDGLASRNGFLLASNVDNSPLVRHFGLSLLDHVLLHTGFALSSTQIFDLKEMVIQLAQRIREEDPSYYRNKVAQLWAEVVKRSWGIDWNAMDQDLFNLWSATALHKELVLTVLETLSEDIFFREDTASSLRGSDLNRALVEIFTPLAVFRETYPERDQHRLEIRYQEDGWLSRICILLEECIGSVNTSRQAKECTLKALAVLRTALVWSIPKAIISCNIVTTICRTLNSQNEHILLVYSQPCHRREQDLIRLLGSYRGFTFSVQQI